MNPPRKWQQRYEPCAMVPVVMLGPVRLFKETRENSVQPLKKLAQVPTIPTARLETNSEFVLSAIANSCMYEVC